MPKIASVPAEVIHRAQDSEPGFRAWLIQHAKNPQAIGLVVIHKHGDTEDDQVAYWTIEEVRDRIEQMAQEILGTLQSFTEDADTPCTFHVTFLRASESGAVLWMSRRFRLKPLKWDEKRDFDGSFNSIIVQTQRHNEAMSKVLVDAINRTALIQTQMMNAILVQLSDGEKGKARLEQEITRLREENAKLLHAERSGDDDDDEALDLPATIEQLSTLLQAAQGMVGGGQGNGAS